MAARGAAHIHLNCCSGPAPSIGLHHHILYARNVRLAELEAALMIDFGLY